MCESRGFKLRVRYHKASRLMYLGHLEVLRTVERIIRRAELPYAITQGFSPHMKISFSSASPLGVESFAEYYDLMLTEYIPSKEVLARLKKVSPQDLMPQACAYVDLKSPSLTVDLSVVCYEMDLYLGELSFDLVQAGLKSLLDKDEICFEKKGKKKKIFLHERILKTPELVLGEGGSQMVEPCLNGELSENHGLNESASKKISVDLHEGDSQDLRKNCARLSLVVKSGNEGSLRPALFLDALATEIASSVGDSWYSRQAEFFKSRGIPLTSVAERIFERTHIRKTHQYREDSKKKWKDPLIAFVQESSSEV